jgi:hypothetical protein
MLALGAVQEIIVDENKSKATQFFMMYFILNKDRKNKSKNYLKMDKIVIIRFFIWLYLVVFLMIPYFA